MTFVVVSLFGAGIVFILSAIENVSISETFKKIINGEKFNLGVAK